MNARTRWALLLALPFLAAFVGARLVVPSMSNAIARALRVGARAIAPPRARATAPPKAFVVESNDVVVDVGDGGLEASTSPADRSARGKPDASSPGKGGSAPVPAGPLRISAEAVQRAIDDDGRTLRARTTFGPDGKPAGARVTGVNGTGMGLRDGDVIIAVDGHPTMDDDAATDAALRAVARGDSVLHATLTRDGQPFEVVLELPLAPADAGKPPARR